MSDAVSVPMIVAELMNTSVCERAGRAQDREDAYAMQKLRKDGYM